MLTTQRREGSRTFLCSSGGNEPKLLICTAAVCSSDDLNRFAPLLDIFQFCFFDFRFKGMGNSAEGPRNGEKWKKMT